MTRFEWEKTRRRRREERAAGKLPALTERSRAYHRAKLARLKAESARRREAT